MNEILPVVRVGRPDTFKPAEIEDFVALVVAGDEVTSHGLIDRVLRSELIAFLRKGECLLGVAGLKKPSQNHRTKIANGANAALSEEEFPVELGWVFILPSARGSRLSLSLCTPIINAAGRRGIFATSRTTNASMHRTLTDLGFVRIGKEWPSRHGNSLALFTRGPT